MVTGPNKHAGHTSKLSTIWTAATGSHLHTKRDHPTKPVSEQEADDVIGLARPHWGGGERGVEGGE